jgi:hypothetical protein
LVQESFSFFRGESSRFSFLLLTASEHSILFVLVTRSVHFCVEATEQVHTYVFPFLASFSFLPFASGM